MKKNTIIPLTRFGFCRMISVSVCPKPPTFGSSVNAWSTFTTSSTFTIKSSAGGIVWFVVPPSAVVITTLRCPFSNDSIAVIFPAALDVRAVLLLFSPVGYTCPRPRFPPT